MKSSYMLERLSRSSPYVQVMVFSLTLSSLGALQVLLLTGLVERSLLVFGGGTAFLSSCMGLKVLLTDRRSNREPEHRDPLQ